MRYTRSLFSTKNVKTEKVTYFMMVCDAPRRISKADFDEYKTTADSLSCLSTTVTKKHVRHHTVCNYSL